MKVTNNNNIPDMIYRAICNDSYDGPSNDPSKISVTTLIGPPRVRCLSMRHWDEISEDAVDRVWALFGQACHSVLERTESKDGIQELRIEKELDGLIISGQADHYENNTIYDYKITSAWTLVYEKQGRQEWHTQLNVYKWLFESQGYRVDALKDILILRDWSALKAKTDWQYPQCPVVEIDIQPWMDSNIEKYLKGRVQEHRDAMLLADEELPLCTDAERWAKETVWAVKKDGRKSSIKNCSSRLDAQKYIAQQEQKGLYIEERIGEDKRCTTYCPVKNFCSYYQKVYGNE